MKIYNNVLISAKNVAEKLNQLEITFIDHINIKDFGLESYQLNEIFNNFTFSDHFKSIECNFTIPQETINGNLTLILRSAINIKDQSRIIVCETTCRGSLVNSESMGNWYNKSHNILLDYFIDLFSEKSKIIWGGKKWVEF